MADTALCLASASPADDQRTILPTLVPGHLRLAFLPRVFGPRHYGQAEAEVYGWMGNLCPEYHGGYWQFYDLSNGGFYLAPEAKVTADQAGPVFVVRAPNGFEETMSYDAAGITATLYAINSLIWKGADHLEDAFYKLRDFAIEHRESRQILRAID